MNDTATDARPRAHLGFRIAVGVVGVALLALFALLASVTLKQSAATQALETQASPREGAQPAPIRK